MSDTAFYCVIAGWSVIVVLGLICWLWHKVDHEQYPWPPEPAPEPAQPEYEPWPPPAKEPGFFESIGKLISGLLSILATLTIAGLIIGYVWKIALWVIH